MYYLKYACFTENKANVEARGQKAFDAILAAQQKDPYGMSESSSDSSGTSPATKKRKQMDLEILSSSAGEIIPKVCRCEKLIELEKEVNELKK